MRTQRQQDALKWMGAYLLWVAIFLSGAVPLPVMTAFLLALLALGVMRG